MIGGVMPSGNESSRPIIAKALARGLREPAIISVDAIKPPTKQHNVVIQKAFLYLLRFSLPQSVVAILTIARIIKTKSAIENMEPSTKITITMEGIAKVELELSATIKVMIYSRIITPINENEVIPKFLINLAFFKIDSWLLHVDDLSGMCISGDISDLSKA